jgi:hypothetical protein
MRKHMGDGTKSEIKYDNGDASISSSITFG